MHGNKLVCVYARGDAPFQRVVLALGRADRPGREAEAALRLIGDVHRVTGAGVQAVVYDGALRGVHIEHLMTRHGLVVVNKVAASPLGDEAKAERNGSKANKSYPLGLWQHDTAAGPCTHTLAAVDGAIVEMTLDDAGDPVVAHPLVRRQVKRPRRVNGNHHFSAAFTVPCDLGAFDAWITPHGEPGDPDARRAENVRLRGLQQRAEALAARRAGDESGLAPPTARRGLLRLAGQRRRRPPRRQPRPPRNVGTCLPTPPTRLIAGDCAQARYTAQTEQPVYATGSPNRWRAPHGSSHRDGRGTTTQ